MRHVSSTRLELVLGARASARAQLLRVRAARRVVRRAERLGHWGVHSTSVRTRSGYGRRTPDVTRVISRSAGGARLGARGARAGRPACERAREAAVRGRAEPRGDREASVARDVVVLGDVLGQLVRVHLWLRRSSTVRYITHSATCSVGSCECTCGYKAFVQYITLRIRRRARRARARAPVFTVR